MSIFVCFCCIWVCVSEETIGKKQLLDCFLCSDRKMASFCSRWVWSDASDWNDEFRSTVSSFDFDSILCAWLGKSVASERDFHLSTREDRSARWMFETCSSRECSREHSRNSQTRDQRWPTVYQCAIPFAIGWIPTAYGERHGPVFYFGTMSFALGSSGSSNSPFSIDLTTRSPFGCRFHSHRNLLCWDGWSRFRSTKITHGCATAQSVSSRFYSTGESFLWPTKASSSISIVIIVRDRSIRNGKSTDTGHIGLTALVPENEPLAGYSPWIFARWTYGFLGIHQVRASLSSLVHEIEISSAQLVGSAVSSLLCFVVVEFNSLLRWCSVSNDSLGTSEEPVLREQGVSNILWTTARSERRYRSSITSECWPGERYDASADGWIYVPTQLFSSSRVQCIECDVYCLYTWWLYSARWSSAYERTLARLSRTIHSSRTH